MAIQRSRAIQLALVGVLLVGLAILVINPSTSRRLTAETDKYSAFGVSPPSTGSTPIISEHLSHAGRDMPFLLPERAADWCMPPSLGPLDFENCDAIGKPVNRLPLVGGMTNALKFVLLGIIESYEAGRCFYIDESGSHLKLQSGGEQHSLIRRYFAPMGLDPESLVVQKALLEARVETKDWTVVWEWEKRRVISSEHFIPYLVNEHVDGHRLKFITLMRAWRPLAMVRNAACSALEGQGLRDDFLALSVRRGDKHTVEKFDYPTAESYVAAAEHAIATRFGGVRPKIFVATDDCSVMGELRTLRPEWNFVSQCDLTQNGNDNGFALSDMKDWSAQDMDQHYEKFMTELFGLAIAKYVVGVTYTNVSWWVLFMRRANIDETEYLDTDGSSPRNW